MHSNVYFSIHLLGINKEFNFSQNRVELWQGNVFTEPSNNFRNVTDIFSIKDHLEGIQEWAHQSNVGNGDLWSNKVFSSLKVLVQWQEGILDISFGLVSLNFVKGNVSKDRVDPGNNDGLKVKSNVQVRVNLAGFEVVWSIEIVVSSSGAGNITENWVALKETRSIFQNGNRDYFG